MKHMIILLIFIMSFQTFATVDPANTYQWNRRNALQENGKIDQGEWYEWWYYKVVDPKTGKAYFFVYGVVNPWDLSSSQASTRAYVGAGDFDRKIVFNQNYPVDQFRARYNETFVAVSENIASDKALQGKIRDEQGNLIKWNLNLKKEWAFNPISWALNTSDFLNIYWYPAQGSATMSGTIEVNGELIELKDAPAYQDRNWGRSFPKWWAWIVSNQFENSKGTYLACGGGSPKVFNRYVVYEGMSVGFHHQGKDYTFRPNDGDRFKFTINYGKWEIIGTSKKGYKIVINAHAPKEKFMLLKFMSPQGVEFKDYETLNGHVDVALYQFRAGSEKPWNLITQVTSEFAGIEWGSFDDQLTIFDSALKIQE